MKNATINHNLFTRVSNMLMNAPTPDDATHTSV